MAEATFSHPDNDRLTVSETSKERAITFDLGIFDLINKSQIHLQSFEDRTQQQNAIIKVNIFYKKGNKFLAPSSS